jgi:hypothetical protein
MARRRIVGVRSNSRGFVLISLLVILTMGTLYFFVGQLTPTAVDELRQQRTEAALQAARDALLGFAIRYRDQQAAQAQPGRMFGFLPMPDMGSTRNTNGACPFEGCEANTPGGVSLVDGLLPALVGRLPWQSLGIEPLRDGYGECLWLIISTPYLAKNATNVATVADPPRMNWDTIGQFDIVTANGSAALVNDIASAHDRPVAIIYAPGAILPGQDRFRATNGDVITECGGNYDARNYLDPQTAGTLGVTNYLAGTNNASGAIGTVIRSDDPDPAKPVLTRSKLFLSGSNYVGTACKDCSLLSNDTGLALTNDAVSSAIRKNPSFRSDVDRLMDSMGTCLESAGAFTPIAMPGTIDGNHGKAPDSANSCAAGNSPLGYFNHYRENALVAIVSDINACKTNPTIAGNCLDVAIQDPTTNSIANKKCHGVLILSGQRAPGQLRVSDTERKTASNYLEGSNLTSFTTANQWTFSGARQLAATSAAFPAQRDIVRCIPDAGYSTTNSNGLPFVSVQNAALTPYGGQLSGYNATNGTLTLGLEQTTVFPPGLGTDLYGCAWQPDTHSFSNGLRSYFKFRINDSSFTTTPLDGFTFAIVDGDANGVNACGAAQQHLGYSGNNLDTPTIKAPKIGIEVDLRRNFSGTSGFDPSGANTLTNGRIDPNYTGGHVGIVYWGGDTNIITTTSVAACTAPRLLVGSTCYLPPEEDDNIHGYPATVSGCRPSPPNPTAPATPTLASGTYKLSPTLSSVPTNQDFHMRVEITRGSSTPAPAPVLPAVRVATTGQINLATPGASIDGVSLITNDRILVHRQALPRENGIYVWTGASTPLIRSSDFDSAKELAGAVVTVAEGTVNSATTWRQASINPTPDSDDQYWANVHVRVATQSNLNISLPGASIDTITLADGDRILVKAQTTTSENGIYRFNTATTPLTRSIDADTQTRRTGMIVNVNAGTDAHTWWRSDGTNWSRPQVRLATQANINLSSPGTSIDGCTVMAAGDRVLVRAQTDATQNGIYIWNSAGTAMTRPTDADQASELAGALYEVTDGSDIARAFQQTSFGASDSLGTEIVRWVPLGARAAEQFVVQAWILADSVTDANRIAAMKETGRAMSTLDSSFTPHLKDSSAIYHPFRTARLGFTVSQSTLRNDQTVLITNQSTTWIQ